MTVRTDKAASRSRRLQAAIRSAYRGEQLDDATIDWLKTLPTETVTKARYEIASVMWDRLVQLSTAKRLFPGDASALSPFDFHDNVVCSKFAFDVMNDLGHEDASTYFEELSILVSLPL